jgi:hypothetical protein
LPIVGTASSKRPGVRRFADACDPQHEQSHRFNAKKTVEGRWKSASRGLTDGLSRGGHRRSNGTVSVDDVVATGPAGEVASLAARSQQLFPGLMALRSPRRRLPPLNGEQATLGCGAAAGPGNRRARGWLRARDGAARRSQMGCPPGRRRRRAPPRGHRPAPPIRVAQSHPVGSVGTAKCYAAPCPLRLAL